MVVSPSHLRFRITLTPIILPPLLFLLPFLSSFLILLAYPALCPRRLHRSMPLSSPFTHLILVNAYVSFTSPILPALRHRQHSFILPTYVYTTFGSLLTYCTLPSQSALNKTRTRPANFLTQDARSTSQGEM